MLQTARYRHLTILSWHRDTQCDHGDTGIDTFGTAILTEVSQVSHNSTWKQGRVSNSDVHDNEMASLLTIQRHYS